MAGSTRRKAARAARVAAAFLAVAVVLGLGSPMATRSVDTADVRSPAGLSAAGLAAVASAAAAVDPAVAPVLHPTVPRGYSVPAPAVATAHAPAATPPAGRTPPAPAATPAPARPTPAAPAPAPAPATSTTRTAALPLPISVGSSTQVITVVAPSARSTTATLTAWQLGPTGWTAAFPPVSARIGAQGVGQASEDLSRTPAGTFTLTQAFGRAADPGTRLPYRVLTAADYWVSDRTSPLYNQFQQCSSACPFNTAAGEHLLDAGASYNYAVVIDYNRHPAVPGAGSAFFLHVTNGAATAGCVAIPQSSLVAIMGWLNPAARPLISIGVG